MQLAARKASKAGKTCDDGATQPPAMHAASSKQKEAAPQAQEAQEAQENQEVSAGGVHGSSSKDTCEDPNSSGVLPTASGLADVDVQEQEIRDESEEQEERLESQAPDGGEDLEGEDTEGAAQIDDAADGDGRKKRGKKRGKGKNSSSGAQI